MRHQDPRQAQRTYDTFHMGRSCMDLYSNDVGVDFVHIKSFAAYVGGSPTNMSVGCRRLGPLEGLPTGQRLRCNGGKPARLLHFHALLGRGDGFCGRAGRVVIGFKSSGQ